MNKTHPKPPASGSAAQLLPTLGLLPVLAISAGVGGPAQAQDTVTLDTAVIRRQQGSEAETRYKTTESASDKITAPLLDTPRTVTVVTARQIKERGGSRRPGCRCCSRASCRRMMPSVRSRLGWTG